MITSGLFSNRSGPGRSPWISSPPSNTAAEFEPGLPPRQHLDKPLYSASHSSRLTQPLSPFSLSHRRGALHQSDPDFRETLFPSLA